MVHAEFMPISVATLVPTTVVGMDLYHGSADGSPNVLFRGRNYPLLVEDIANLRERKVINLYIKSENRLDYQFYLRQLVEGKTESASFSARTSALGLVVRNVLQTAFAQDDVDTTVQAACELAKMATDIVGSEAFKSSELLRVLHHDYTTFTHSANVALYSAILAKTLGYTSDEISQITVGGLLHDLGKLNIPEAILCKPGRLDEKEFRVIQTHPTSGFRQLISRSDLSLGQLMMVYQHHERVDGSGYPVGIDARDMHPWAKLCAVVDVFEAVTSNRPYRKPMLRSEAIELLRREAGQSLDKEMVECWATAIQTKSND
jgi:HD-GYP domain-containing protein (c-di-GMP phosphodiesterase class II)